MVVILNTKIFKIYVLQIMIQKSLSVAFWKEPRLNCGEMTSLED